MEVTITLGKQNSKVELNGKEKKYKTIWLKKMILSDILADFEDNFKTYRNI